MPPERAPGGRLVLVVDDDPDILQTLALCLSTEGYRVLTASNGQEALELLKENKPHALLLDLMMPVMDGWQFVAELDARGWGPSPLLILGPDPTAPGHPLKPRASPYLAHPIDL